MTLKEERERVLKQSQLGTKRRFGETEFYQIMFKER